MKKFNKFYIVLAFVLITAALGNMTAVYAAKVPQGSKITVKVDNRTVVFVKDPMLINNSAMVPLMEFAEAMEWEARENSTTVFELAKVVRYTDGVKKYLFSCHTVTVDFNFGRVDRSIMVGVGNFLDTADDHNISFTVKPVVIDGVTYVGVRDLAKWLYSSVEWDSASQTVSITSGAIPYYDGQGLTNREELFEQMRKYYKISGELTKTGKQSTKSSEPLETESQVKNIPFKPTGIMTAAPKVGSIPAKILLTDKTDVKSEDSYREPYKNNISSGCNWYSFGRLYETTGIWIPAQYQFGTRGGLKDVESASLDYVKVERDINNIVSGSVAIFVGKDKDYTGHSIFVEYVEHGKNGKPVNIYYTDSNRSRTGYYDPNRDAKVIKVSFEKFTKLYQTKVFDGYMIPAQ